MPAAAATSFADTVHVNVVITGHRAAITAILHTLEVSPMAEVFPQLWPTTVTTQVVSLLVHQEASLVVSLVDPPPQYNAPPVGYGQLGGFPPGPPGILPAHANVQQQQYSNVVKRYSN
jgi:hypothetical protein